MVVVVGSNPIGLAWFSGLCHDSSIDCILRCIKGLKMHFNV